MDESKLADRGGPVQGQVQLCYLRGPARIIVALADELS
jgi:hypothetical protein